MTYNRYPDPLPFHKVFVAKLTYEMDKEDRRTYYSIGVWYNPQGKTSLNLNPGICINSFASEIRENSR